MARGIKKRPIRRILHFWAPASLTICGAVAGGEPPALAAPAVRGVVVPDQRTTVVVRPDAGVAQVMGYVLRNTLTALFATVEYNPGTCVFLDDPTLSEPVAPKHGTVTSTTQTLAIPAGSPCAGTMFPFTVANYTWTDGAKTGTVDDFSITSTYTYEAPVSTTVGITLAPVIKLSRSDLLTIVASGLPSSTGGSFTYAKVVASGTTVAPLAMGSGVTVTTNPNTGVLSNPPNPSAKGSPSPGGLGKYTINYLVSGQASNNDASDPFKVPTFGMSCYYTALQSDWGTPPKACKSISINGTTYSGTVTDPGGYAGTYCSSFIGEVELQGSGTLNDGTNIQYNVNTGDIAEVSAINGSDGTPVMAGQTLARSKTIIPTKGVYLNVNGVGTKLLANDTGGGINGYRLDLYQGPGKAVCAGYNNQMSVSACTPELALCPGSALQ